MKPISMYDISCKIYEILDLDTKEIPIEWSYLYFNDEKEDEEMTDAEEKEMMLAQLKNARNELLIEDQKELIKKQNELIKKQKEMLRIQNEMIDLLKRANETKKKMIKLLQDELGDHPFSED